MWGLAPAHISVYKRGARVTVQDATTNCPPASWLVSILDDSDQAGALGYHAEVQGSDKAYARVFVKPTLDAGGSVVGDKGNPAYSVSVTLSHEVLEAFADPNVNLWADMFDSAGTQVAVEVGDPVESDAYIIDVGRFGRKRPIAVSNFVTPAWFDAQTPDRPTDYMNSTGKPFEMSKGGYMLKRSVGRITSVFGEEYPAWKRPTKLADMARTARRLRTYTGVTDQG